MKIAISQITTLPADTEADIDAFSKAGWTAVELALSKINRYLAHNSIDRLKTQLQDAGLEPIAAIGLASSEPALLLSKDKQFDAFIDNLKQQLEICAALKINNLGIGADPSSHVYDGWQEQAAKNLLHAAELAKSYDVRLGLEFMSLAPPIGPFVLDDLDTTLAMVNAADHPNVGYNLDLFHYFRSGGTVEGIRRLDTRKLYHVHLCDIPQMPREELNDGHRILPGAGILPMTEIVNILKDKGYEGYLALELLNEPLWEQGPYVTAEEGMKSMQPFV